ncbi:MAG: 3TM-type holin [Planctomycetota bacterium]
MVGIGSILGQAGGLWGTVFGDKGKREEQRHQQVIEGLGLDQATLAQFAAEFTPQSNRTWWDSLVDGLNRLPRPIMALGVLSMFVLAPIDPVRFTTIAEAYSVIPPGFWALLSIIIGFYFGGRMQLKSQDFQVKGQQASAAALFAKSQRQLAEAVGRSKEPLTERAYQAALANNEEPLSNRVIMEWNRRHQQDD